jgi:hypothetical protein
MGVSRSRDLRKTMASFTLVEHANDVMFDPPFARIPAVTRDLARSSTGLGHWQS